MKIKSFRYFYENFFFCLYDNIILENNGPSAWQLISLDVVCSS